MRKLLLYSAFLLLTQCSKCKNDDPTPKEPELPAETQSGARTLGCKVNGEVFTTVSTTRVNAIWGCIDCFYIGADTQGANDAGFNMIISLSGANAEGAIFQLLPVSTPNPPVRYGSAAAVTDVCDYDGRLLKSGQVTFTRFDEVARIASGRFAFTLYKPGCDTLRVTDGRFDVKL
jgi:hypothetical protein